MVTRYGGFAAGSILDGVATGSDANVFVAEESLDKITKVTGTGPTAGIFLAGGSGGDRPTSLVTGPSVAGPRGSGSVWASLTGAKAVARIDTLTGAAETISTAAVSDCGPRGIAVGPGGSYMYFTLPNPGDGSCTSPSMIGWVSTTAFTPVTAAAGFGAALDLDISGTKLFVPDPAADVIRRAALDPATGAPTLDGTFPIPGGGSPRGITAARDGSLWLTLFIAGKVARLDPAAADGTPVALVEPGAPFAQPFGIATGTDGFVYAASYGSAQVARFAADGTATVYPLGAGYSPWQITVGPEGEIWITNRDHRTIARFVHGAPRPLTGGYSEGPKNAFVSGTVDPQGNTTEAYYEYGTTTAYGSQTGTTTLNPSTPFKPAPLPAVNPVVLDAIPVGPVMVSGEMTGLTPKTTYHYRLVATNSEGTRIGTDRTLTTPAAEDADKDGHSPPEDCDDNDAKIHPGAKDIPSDNIDQDCSGSDAKYQRLRARVTVTARNSGASTRIRTLRVTRLAGGESVKVTCKGRGCKFKSRTRKAKRGTLKLDSLFAGRSLRNGARVVVRVTKANMVGTSVAITARRGAKPKIVRRCLRPGAKNPSVC